MKLPRAILFDLDETIITEGNRLAALVEVAIEFQSCLGDLQPSAVAERLETDLLAFWNDPIKAKPARLASETGVSGARTEVIRSTFASLGLVDTAFANAFSERFTSLRASRLCAFDGALETVVAIRDLGVKLALVTNGGARIQRAKVERFNLEPLFHHVQIEGEHGFGKPEPQAYLNAMSVLGVDPGDTWMVGDNLEWEVAAPQKLGITGIWHDHMRQGLPAGTPIRPDRIILSLPELLQ
jgi:putative hydrolase of the HAD superfamily